MAVSVEGAAVTAAPARGRTRREVLRALFGAAAALVLAPVVGATSRPAPRAGAPADTAFDETYRGRRLRGRPVRPARAGDAGRWRITVDGRPLHLMRRADGTWLSMVDHYCSYATPLAAARAAVDELGPGRAPRATAAGHARMGDTMAYIRKDVSTLTAGERRRLVGALLKLKRRGEYDDFVRMHIDHYVTDGEGGLRSAHMTPSFLPWHRRFLLDLERALRRIDPAVTVPYWDWTRDRAPGSGPWTDDLLGGTGRRPDRMVTSGPFAYGTGDWTIRENVTDADFLTRDLGRPRDPIQLPTPSDVEWALSDPVYDVSPWNSTVTRGFRNKLEGWGTGSGSAAWRNHNRVHRWVGGSMVGGASVNDPVFWLHHAFVDLLWTRWQRRHREHRYLPDRPPAPGTAQYRRVVARHERLQPWGVTPDQLEDAGAIYRYA